MWLTMIILHTVAGAAAFAVGVVALQPERVRRHTWLPTLLAVLVTGLVVFMVGAMAAHWGDLNAAARTVFCVLTVLALYMLHRALRARAASAHLTGPGQGRYMDDVGFVLVALFNGFVIVSALDLNAPSWAVGSLVLLAVLVGHHAIAQAKDHAGFAARSVDEPLDRS